MIELYSKDMQRLISFTRGKWRLNFPDDVSIEDLEHEVAVALYNSQADPITSSMVVKQVFWTRAKLWKEHAQKDNAKVSHRTFRESSDDTLDAKLSVKKMLSIRHLTEQERKLLEYLAKGLDSGQIRAKMHINNRQRYEQIKRTAFFKVRTLCPQANYWGTSSQHLGNRKG